MKAGYTDYFADAGPPAAAYGSGTLDGRYDVSRDLAVRRRGPVQCHARAAVQSLVLVGADGRNPYIPVATYGATIGGAQKFGDLTLALHGTYDRHAYTNVALAGASVRISPATITTTGACAPARAIG